MKTFCASLLLTFPSSTSSTNEGISFDNHQMVDVIFPHFSLLGYTVPIESFIIGLFICLLIFLVVYYHLQLHSYEKFKLAINILQTMYGTVIFLRNQLEEIVVENSSSSVSRRLKQSVDIANFIIHNEQNILSLDKINGKTFPEDSLVQVELYTYILSVVNRCRPYADFCQVRLNVDKCANCAGCKIYENILTATLQHLLNKIIKITVPGNCIHINVSFHENSWELYISNCKEAASRREAGKFPFIPGMFSLYGYSEFCAIRKIIRAHGGKMLGYGHSKSITFSVVIPINCYSKSHSNNSIDKQMINSKDYLEEHEVTSVYQNTDPISPVSNLPSVLLIMTDRVFSEHLKGALAKYFDVSIVHDPDAAVNGAVEACPDVIIVDELVKGVRENGLCMQIKQRMRNIPVMLLVRSDDSERYLSYVQSGANGLELWTESISKLRADLSILINNYKEFYMRQQKLPSQKISSGSVPAKMEKDTVDQAFVDKVRAFIIKMLAEEKHPKVEMLYAYMGMSATSFRTKMIKNTGMPPTKYIYLCKMQKAAELLVAEDLSISEVAYLSGYSDPRYFGKEFKKYYHLSPSKYIETIKKQERISL